MDSEIRYALTRGGDIGEGFVAWPSMNTSSAILLSPSFLASYLDPRSGQYLEFDNSAYRDPAGKA